MEKAIGIFDSGIGGLSVVRSLTKVLPNEDIIYFGDTARVPYGPKSPKTIQRFSFEISNFLLSKNVKAIIVACNSASATALPLLKNCFNIPIFGVIESGVEAAYRVTETKRIGIIGTKATVNSNLHRDLLLRKDPSIEVFSQECSLFVPLIEEGLIDSPITDLIIQKYLQEMKNNNIDTLILGCTHYPILQKKIEQFLGPNVKTIDPAIEVATKVKKELEKMDLLSLSSKTISSCSFFVSDVPKDFINSSIHFLKLEPHNVEKVILDELTMEEVLKTEIETI